MSCRLQHDPRFARRRNHAHAIAENREVNDIWLCDKGWFGYEFTSHPERLKADNQSKWQTKIASWDEAIELIASKIKQCKMGGKMAALGGNPLTIEENYLFQKLMREGRGRRITSTIA